MLRPNPELGAKYGVAFAEAFHYIGPSDETQALEEYLKRNAVPARR